MEDIESKWTLDLAILEQLSQVATGFSRVADIEEAVKKKDPFRDAAQKAGSYNSTLLAGTRIYAQVTNSAKSYEAEIKRLQTVQTDLNKRQAEFTAAGKYTQLKKELETVTRQLEKLNAEKKKFDSKPISKPIPVPAGGLGGRLGGLGQNLTGQIGGLVGGVFALDKAFDLGVRGPAEFGRALSQLSAITGATGKDLKFLEQQAIQLEKSTGKSALSIVQAFQVVGSIKPELLENKQLLADTTKEVLALQDAAGNISLDQAAESLLGAMNQFGAGAEEASRFVNVLAAGAKAGSSEIVDTSQAFKTAGTALAAANLSFEESNALVQSLAGVMIKGSEAGTALRNVVISLEKSTDKNLRPSVVGLDKALENASVKYNTTTKLSKEFGVENIVAARRILETRGEIQKLTADLTGTETAYEQQRTNLDNLATDMDKLGTSFTGFFRNLGLSQEGFLRFAIQSFTNFINQIGDKSSQLRGLLNIVFNPDKAGAILEYQLERGAQVANEKRRVQEEGIRQQAKTEVPASVRDQAKNLIDQGVSKSDADIQAAHAVLKAETDKLNEARKFYSNTVLEFKKATTEEERKRLINDSKLNAASIKTQKTRIDAAQKELDAAQKRAINQKKALASALIDEGAGDKKANAKADAERKQLLEKRKQLNEELIKLEESVGRQRLQTLDKDSEEYLKLEEQIALESIEIEKQKLLTLAKLAKATIPKDKLALFDQQKDLVRVETNQKRAEAQQKRDDALLDLQADTVEKEIKLIEKKYRDLIKKEKEGSAAYLNLLSLQREQIANARLDNVFRTNEQQEQVDKDVIERTAKPDGMGMVAFEKWKQQKMLEIAIFYKEQRVQLLEAENKPENVPTISRLKTEIFKDRKDLESLKAQPKIGSMLELLGIDVDLTESELEQLTALGDQFKQLVGSLLQTQIAASDERIAKLDEEIAKKEEQVSEEKRLNKEGIASNLSLRQKELSDLKSQKAQEQQERAKAIKAQILMETASVTSTNALTIANTIAAVSEAVKTNAKIPVIGVAAGILAGGSIIAAMASAKQRIRAATKMREGGWLSGPDHEHGGIRGTGAFGHVEVEGGEHITRKRRAQRFADLLDSINEPNKPMPWDGLKKLAMERGISLSDTSGIASPKAVQVYANSYRDRSGRSMSQDSIDRLTSEVIEMRKENTELLKMLNDTSDFVHNGKHYKKVGRNTIITKL